MCFDMWPVGKAGIVTERLETSDIPVDDIKVYDCAGRAELFNNIILECVSRCHDGPCLPSRTPRSRQATPYHSACLGRTVFAWRLYGVCMGDICCPGQ